MKPSHLERKLLRYRDAPDDVVAQAEHVPLADVVAARARLRRGAAVDAGRVAGESIAQLMRNNQPIRGI